MGLVGAAEGSLIPTAMGYIQAFALSFVTEQQAVKKCSFITRDETIILVDIVKEMV